VEDLLRRAQDPALRFGDGVLASAVAASSARFALLSQPAPASAIDSTIRARASVERMIGSLAEADLETLERNLPAVELVLGVGGGMVMDAAKFVAWRRGLPLLLAPSVVSVDACVTNTVAVRRNDTIAYEGFVVAEAILVDFDLIRRAPPELNRAGVGDLLSIHTGLWDWRLGAERGRAVLVPEVAARAAAILDRVEAAADEIGRVTDAAIETIVRAYAEVNALCLEVGHSQPEEGSEHYFAYHLEAVAGHGFVHGEVIGLGTVLMATLQGNDPDRARRIIERARLDWSLRRLGVDRGQVLEALVGLPAFVRSAGLPYSVIDQASISRTEAGALLRVVLPEGGVRP